MNKNGDYYKFAVDMARDQRLRDSAEDLLEVCKEVITWAEEAGNHGGNPWTFSFVINAQKAIERATGK